jgi:hypothetical protein
MSNLRVITFKTFRKYCKLKYALKPYRCHKLMEEYGTTLQNESQIRCNEENCPVWKRLWINRMVKKRR